MTAAAEKADPVSGLARHWIDAVLARAPLARHLGIRVDVVETDRVVLGLPFSPGNVTVGSIVHGGVIATLIDIAGAAASASGIGEEGASGGATASLNIAYLAAADGVDLLAEARIIQRTRSGTVADVDVRDASGRAIAKGLVTSRIFRSPRASA